MELQTNLFCLIQKGGESMEYYWNLIIAGVLLILSGLGIWKVWPLVKESWIYEKARAIVDQMEEEFGSGTGAIKFDVAVQLMQEWINKRGWKIDVKTIMQIVTSAVGSLHAEQGEKASKKLTDAEIQAKKNELGVETKEG